MGKGVENKRVGFDQWFGVLNVLLGILGNMCALPIGSVWRSNVRTSSEIYSRFVTVDRFPRV
jgi:hypothetical protein